MPIAARPNDAILNLVQAFPTCPRCQQGIRITKDGRLNASFLCGHYLSKAIDYAAELAKARSRRPTEKALDAAVLSVLALDRMSVLGFEKAANRLLDAKADHS